MTKNEKPAIIFDFGGVLIDWNPLYLYVELFDGDRQAAERFLVDIDFYGWNKHQDAGRPFSEAVEALCQKYPEHCELITAYNERYLDSISGPITATVTILEQLYQEGYTLYGLSNFPQEKWELVRPRYPFFQYLTGWVISGEVGLAKPDPLIYEKLLDVVGRPAGECVLIDDSEDNVEIAREIGFVTIHFSSPSQLEDELRQMGLLHQPA